MAWRFNNILDWLRRSGDTSGTTFTFMCWAQLVSSAGGNIKIIFNKGSGCGSGINALGMRSDGARLTMSDCVTDHEGSTAISTGTWYHIALTVDGGATGAAFLDGVEEISGRSIGSVGAPGELYLGGDPIGNVANCRLAGIKMYTRVLTAAEIAQESKCLVPLRTDDLHIWSPAVANSGTLFLDYSGNDFHWDEDSGSGSNVTAEPGPPVAYRPSAKRKIIPPEEAAVPPVDPNEPIPTVAMGADLQKRYYGAFRPGDVPSHVMDWIGGAE